MPQPTRTDIVNKAAAIRLGKAFFWDTQTGGDGKTACASCHFFAGEDIRLKNTIHPGPDGIFASGGVNGSGQTFSLQNILNDDRAGSQGVAASTFVGISTNFANPADQCTAVTNGPFGTDRQVTGRNTPSNIGAVFNRDNFWDGRANHAFNGSDPFGFTGNAGGSLFSTDNNSLASQSVGPANNSVEMSCAGRAFNGANSLAAKLLPRQPLQFQRVSSTDGVLGAFASPTTGLNCGNHACTYYEMVTAAYGSISMAQAQSQFSRYWGQAVAAYEATLIPDQTPLDRFLAGNNSALTSSQQKGLNVFSGKGSCTKCHAGGELSDATVSFIAKNGLINEDGGDQGFHNIGVRPTAEDLGRAASGPNNVPFSVSRKAADRGAFKTPQLRNVKLNPPYFSNGGKATLRDVVEFYNIGGDFPNAEKAKRIKPLGLAEDEKVALVDFLTNALTDCRVEKQRAPFDHPELDEPNGPHVSATGASGTGSCP